MSITKQEAFAAIDRSAGLIHQVSDAVWEHPETAFEEWESMNIHCEALEQCGFAVERGVGKVVIMNGTVNHALLLEAVSQKSIGTTITKD